MDFLSKNCIFIGYSINHQGYKCLDVITGKIFISYHVVFDESIYPYTIPKSATFIKKFNLVVIPPNLQLSPSSSLISTCIIIQNLAQSHLHMALTSNPSTDLHVDSSSHTRNDTHSQ